MKIAVLSTNVLGIEFANYLSSIGADVVLFTSQPSELSPISADIKIISDKILWVQKKSISKSEYLANDRMKDLFRIVFEIKPDFSTLDPNFSQDLATSLQKELDMFIDVDGVIDFEDNVFEYNYTHPSHAPALGEIKYKNFPGISYEPLAADINLPETGEIAVLGHSLNSTLSLMKIFQWLSYSKEKERRVFWITHRSNPWDYIYDDRVLTFKEKFALAQEEKIKKFLLKNKSWMELEDYEKVKIIKPQEPIPELVIFAGHHTTAIDTLLNSSKVYLTLESSPLHPVTIQSDNALRELKTISVDQFFIFNGYKNARSWNNYLAADEPGYLAYNTKQLSLVDVIKDFERNFLVFFRNESEGKEL